MNKRQMEDLLNTQLGIIEVKNKKIADLRRISKQKQVQIRGLERANQQLESILGEKVRRVKIFPKALISGRV